MIAVYNHSYFYEHLQLLYLIHGTNLFVDTYLYFKITPPRVGLNPLDEKYLNLNAENQGKFSHVYKLAVNNSNKLKIILNTIILARVRKLNNILIHSNFKQFTIGLPISSVHLEILFYDAIY